MRIRLILAGLIASVTSLPAEDFTLTQGNIGPIHVHTEMTYQGKGERLVATATNDSGVVIPYVRFCVSASMKGCLFTMWTTAAWQPGKQLSWDTTSNRKVPNLSHEVRIDSLNATPVAPAPNTSTAEVPQSNPTPDPKPQVSEPTRAPPPAPPVTQAPPGTPMLLDGTPVRARLTRNLTSAEAKVGDTVVFEVLDDIVAAGTVMIPRGANAMGTVTDAATKKSMGRAGHLDVGIDYVRTATGDKILLRGVQNTKAGGHIGAMTGAIVATSIVFFPAAPLFLFVHGKDAVIPKGHEVTVYVNGDYPVRSTVSAPAPQTQPITAVTGIMAPIQPATPAGQKAMTNADILALHAAAFSDDLIISKILTSIPDFKLETEDLVKLKQAGISEAVITAMLKAHR